MKKIICILSVAILLSCSDNDTEENHDFLKQITGVYFLEEVHSDIPLDLNMDGVPKTDLLDEIDCFSNYPPELFRSDIVYKPAYGGYWNLTFRILEHTRFLDDIPDDNCFTNVSLTYDYAVNESTKEISITWRDDEREAEYGTLTDIKWMDNKAHYYVKKRYYTSEGWTVATIHLVYKKYTEKN